MALRATPADLRRGQLVHYAGFDFTWTGLIAHLSVNHAVIIEPAGKLARVERYSGELKTVRSHATENATIIAGVNLLNRTSVRDAVAIASETPIDPAGYDQWNLALGELTRPGIPLRPLLAAYMGMSAHMRRQFERSLGCLLDVEDADAQYEAFYWTVLGALSDGQAATRRGVSPAAIRMARMRARRRMRDYLGDYLDEAARSAFIA